MYKSNYRDHKDSDLRISSEEPDFSSTYSPNYPNDYTVLSNTRSDDQNATTDYAFEVCMHKKCEKKFK